MFRNCTHRRRRRRSTRRRANGIPLKYVEYIRTYVAFNAQSCERHAMLQAQTRLRFPGAQRAGVRAACAQVTAGDLSHGHGSRPDVVPSTTSPTRSPASTRGQANSRPQSPPRHRPPANPRTQVFLAGLVESWGPTSRKPADTGAREARCTHPAVLASRRNPSTMNFP